MAGEDVAGSPRFRYLTTHIGLALARPDRAVVHHQLAIRGNGNPGTGAILLALAFAGELHFPGELPIGGDLTGAAPGLAPKKGGSPPPPPPGRPLPPRAHPLFLRPPHPPTHPPP